MKIRVLVVGSGFMGQTHAGNLLRNGNAEVAAIVDTVVPVECLKQKSGNIDCVTISEKEVMEIPHYTTLDEALLHVKADAAIIALPTKYHCEAVVKCLNASLHVMVEKPFAISLDECAYMNETAAKNNRLLAVGYLCRCRWDHAYIGAALKTGRLGKLKHLFFQRLTGVPSWGNWTNPEFVKASGGALFDLASHDIDVARYLLGEPDELYAHPILSGEFNGNLVSAVMKYPEVTVAVEAGFITPSAFPFQRTFHAYFEHGTISVQPGMPGLREVRDTGEILYPEIAQNDAYADEVGFFLRSIMENDSSIIVSTGDDAIKTTACCIELQRQMKSLI